METFLGNYIPREKNKVQVEDLINHRNGTISVEDYSLKYTLFSKYDPSLVSNIRDKMSRLLTIFSYLVKEEYYMTILHDNMTLYRLILYAQSIRNLFFRVGVDM